MRLYEPIEPALATPSKGLDDLVRRVDLVRKGQVALEYKIDGFRCVAHHGDKDLLHSRDLNQFSNEAYPEVVQGIAQLGLEDTILDGELVAYDPKTKKLAPFQQTMKRKRDSFNSKGLPLQYLVFDVLMVDGKEVVGLPYNERREILEGLDWNGTVKLIDVELAEDKEAISAFYDQALEKGFEGIMAKRVDSPYAIGKRGNNWVKLKPTMTVDCVVMGWYYGNGSREEWSSSGSEGVGAFLFGVYNPDTGKYETLVKAGSGLTKDWAVDLLEKAKGLESEKMPKDYVPPKKKDTLPDHWTSPEIVIELRGQQITKSPDHSSGYSLRFPTLLRMRKDKPAKAATTVSEVEAVCTG
jgi:DNA ligase-1